MDHNKVTMDNIQDNQANSNRTTHRHGHNTMHRLVSDLAKVISYADYLATTEPKSAKLSSSACTRLLKSMGRVF